MAFRLLSRGFIYIAFIVSVIVSWLFKQWHTSQSASLSDPDVEALATDALHNPRWQVRLKAVQRLGETPEAIQFSQLQDLLSDSDSDVRAAVASVLAQAGERVVSELQAAYEGAALDARVTIVQALSHIDSAQTIPALASALKDESVWVRLPAVQALGKFSEAASISALAQALDDPDDEIQDAAERALEQIGTANARKVLRTHATVTTDSWPNE